MSLMVINNSIKVDLINLQTPLFNVGTVEMRLYTNILTLTPTNILADFVEPPDGNYAPIANPAFAGGVLSMNCGMAQGPTVTWVFAHDAGDFYIYGILFYDTAAARVMLAQALDSPILINAPGMPFSLIPILESGSITTPCA